MTKPALLNKMSPLQEANMNNPMQSRFIGSSLGLRNTMRIFAVVLCTAVGISLTSCKKKTEKEVTITSITVTTQPSKTTYTVGEPFDLSGMVVTATYSDGTSASVTVNSGMITFDSSTAGTKTATITVEYKGKKVTTTVSVTVNAPEPTLTSIAISGEPAKKDYFVGEKFDPAGITVTAKYSDNSTKSVPLTDLVFDVDFSNSAGANKTVKVTYKGVSTQITTGINVLSLAQRIEAATSGDIIYLYGDEKIASAITTNKTITLISSVTASGGIRTIGNTVQGYMFSLTAGGNLTLDANVTLDGSGVENNNAPLVFIGNNAVFTMKDGSKITGNNNTNKSGSIATLGGAVLVNGSGASFVMLGGEITKNSDAEGGAVCVQLGISTMSGGKIIGNTSNYGGDMIVSVYWSTPTTFYLSGDAQIGDLWFYANGGTKTSVTLIGEFTGSVASLNLTGDYAVSNVKSYWTNVAVIKAGADSGVTLTKELLDKFPLGEFAGHNNGEFEAIEGYHLYGTKDGEDTVADFGKLVAD